MSIAGGVDRAVARARLVGCETIQIFVKSNVRWNMLSLREGERELFLEARRKARISPVFAHSSYLINLASADRGVRRRSVGSLKQELVRASELELPFLVIHPGSHGGAGEAAGIRKIANALDEAFRALPEGGVKVALEVTAGQGSSIGWRFEHLADIITSSSFPERLGVCLDTAHAFAAGYDIRTEERYLGVMEEFDRLVSLRRLLAIHLNDSKYGLGARRDRHEHIGKGKLGAGAFSLVLSDSRLARLPMVLETPKGREMREDRRNLRLLRELRRRPRSKTLYGTHSQRRSGSGMNNAD